MYEVHKKNQALHQDTFYEDPALVVFLIQPKT